MKKMLFPAMIIAIIIISTKIIRGNDTQENNLHLDEL